MKERAKMSKIEKVLEQVQSGERQYRDMTLQVRELPENDEMVVQGYATTYNQPYYLYRMKSDDGYTIEVREEVDRHAFDDADMNDVILQYNHEGRVFARLSNGTLQLDKDDEKGLLVTADLGGTEIGRQLYEEIKGGYTNKMSFGFTIAKASDLREMEPDNDADEMWVYTIEKVGRLFDVSAVSLPQNDFTSISARAFGNGAIAEVVTERLRTHEEKVNREKRIAELELLIESED